jgi:NitT/TauT family transport system substrate-binding protein
MTKTIGIDRMTIDRRRLLTLTAVGVSVAALGVGKTSRAFAGGETVRWVSPRGTVEVVDDYPYWVAKKFGYFGDIQTTIDPGPLEATATVKLVDQNQADVGYPAPGIFSLALGQGMPLVSVFQMGAADVFDFAFQKGKAPKDLKALEGKTVVLSSAAAQAVCNPLLTQAGVDTSKINYVEAGNGWAQSLSQGQADSALSWEGLRAQWKGQGLDFDYILGRNFSKFPALGFVIRRADFQDAAKKKVYAQYLRGWAAGLEFGRQNPRAATHVAMQQFPGLASQMNPSVATESMMQLGNMYAGRWAERQKWGFHILDSWQLFFDISAKIAQIPKPIQAKDVIFNDLVDDANGFDAAKVKSDAAGYSLPDEYKAIDVDAIAKAL